MLARGLEPLSDRHIPFRVFLFQRGHGPAERSRHLLPGAHHASTDVSWRSAQGMSPLTILIDPLRYLDLNTTVFPLSGALLTSHGCAVFRSPCSTACHSMIGWKLPCATTTLSRPRSWKSCGHTRRQPRRKNLRSAEISIRLAETQRRDGMEHVFSRIEWMLLPHLP